jgi:N-acyl homoserine lactone hydrolase
MAHARQHSATVRDGGQTGHCSATLDLEQVSRRGPAEPGLREELAAIGTEICDVGLAANCHLHVGHCGGNPALGQFPVFVQGAELGTARRTQDYTLPELIEGSCFEPVTGEVEVLPGNTSCRRPVTPAVTSR